MVVLSVLETGVRKGVWVRISLCVPNALLLQLVEGGGSKPLQSRFESEGEYQIWKIPDWKERLLKSLGCYSLVGSNPMSSAKYGEYSR